MSCLGPGFYDTEDGACLMWVPVLLLLKMVCVLYCSVGLAIHVMNRAPEETINRKSPSKHARTGIVGAVPTIGSTDTQSGPVRFPYGLHTVKGAGHVPRPHRAP